MYFVGSGFGLLLIGAWFVVSHQLIVSELMFLLPLALIICVMLDYILRLVTSERACSIATMFILRLFSALLCRLVSSAVRRIWVIC